MVSNTGCRKPTLKTPNLYLSQLFSFAGPLLLGISLGKTNYVLKALKDKGLVKLGNFSRNPNKLQYVHLLTPQGLSEKTQLTLRFLKRKVQEYEQLKAEIDELKHTLESEKSE